MLRRILSLFEGLLIVACIALAGLWALGYGGYGFYEPIIVVILIIVDIIRRRQPKSTEEGLRSQPPISLIPANKPHWIAFKGNKNYYCDFDVTADFHLSVGASDVEIIEFIADYAIQGIYAWNRDVSLELDGHEQEAMGDCKTLKHPFSILAGKTVLVHYMRVCAPTFQLDPAYLYDFGQLHVNVRYRIAESGEYGTIEKFYQYIRGGRLSEIDKLSEIPRLTDEEIVAFKSMGTISDVEFNRLMRYNVTARYCSVRSDNPTAFVEFEPDVDLLRKLYALEDPRKKKAHKGNGNNFIDRITRCFRRTALKRGR